LRYLYEQLVLPFLLIKHRIDLVHSLGYVAPLFVSCINVVTVPDMNYVDLRQNFPWFKRLMLSIFSSASARLTNHVITISNFSKSVICRRLGISPSKITVTHLGPGWLGKPTSPIDWESLRVQYDLPGKYIIAFGGGALHKNIPRLIEAYLECTELHNYALVIMGRLPANVQLSDTPGKSRGPIIQWLGYVHISHIQPLLCHSALYVLPSLYEGFGMPILEAQFAGALVASSNAASLPEIGAEGAIYFDPLSVPAICEAIRAGLKGEASWIAGIRRAAEANLERFSWKATAQASLDIYFSLFRSTNPHPETSSSK
jgi:glycosyltransferase involved in cell wall biosynthesis